MFTERLKNLPAYALGFNTLLLGMPGSGKTTALVQLAKVGFDVFIVFTEANGPTNLLKAAREFKLTKEEFARIHWKYISASPESFSVLTKQSQVIQRASEFGKIEGGSRDKYGQLIELMKQCATFVDQNGVDFGAVDDWGPARVLCLDSLSGLNDMAMSITIGGKPCASQQDWMVAMKQEMDMVKACVNSRCSFVMTGHLAQEKDEVSGRLIVTPNALGQKNGPALTPLFGDIVLCEKNGSQFTWATTDSKIASLKNSFLPLKDKMVPSFQVLADNWLKEYESEGV